MTKMKASLLLESRRENYFISLSIRKLRGNSMSSQGQIFGRSSPCRERAGRLPWDPLQGKCWCPSGFVVLAQQFILDLVPSLLCIKIFIFSALKPHMHFKKECILSAVKWEQLS